MFCQGIVCSHKYTQTLTKDSICKGGFVVVRRRQSSRKVEIKCTIEQDRHTHQQHKDVYPPYEVPTPEEGPFPVRHPGNYPSAHIQSEEPELESENKEFDMLRDGALRYLGYANELGEAFAAWLPPGGVPFSYAVAIAYVLTDTIDKGNKARKEASEDLQKVQTIREKNSKLINLLAGERAIDTVIWQLLASVALPGATIHFIVAFAHYMLNTSMGLDQNDAISQSSNLSYFVALASFLNTDVATVVKYVVKSVPTFAGLAAIPFIVHPIDNGVHAILNHTLRPAMRVLICDSEEGKQSGLAVCEINNIENDFPVLKGQGPLGPLGEGLLNRSSLVPSQDGNGDDEQFWNKIADKTSDENNNNNHNSQNSNSNGALPQNVNSNQEFQQDISRYQNGVSNGNSEPSSIPSESNSQIYKFQKSDDLNGDMYRNSFDDCEVDGCGVLCQYRRSRDEGLHHGSVGRALARASVTVVPIGVVLMWSHLHAHADALFFNNF